MIRHLVLLGALAACGHAAQPSTFSRLSLLPQETGFVMGFDAVKLKQTHAWAAIGPKLVAMGLGNYEQRQLDLLKGRCDLDPVRDLHWILVASPASGRRLRTNVLLVNAAWDRTKVDRCAVLLRGRDERRAPTAARRSATDRELFGQMPEAPVPLEAYDTHEATGPYVKYGDLWIGWVAPDTAAIAFDSDSLGFLTQVINNPSHSSVLQNQSVSALIKKVDPNAVLWFAGAGERGKFYDLDPFGSDVLKHATETFLSITLGNELQMHFSALQHDIEEIGKLSGYLSERVNDKLEGLPLVDHLKVTTAGAEIHADAHLDAKELETVTMIITAAIDSQIAKHARYAKEVPTELPPMPPVDGDRDGDGIPDSLDKCPDQPEDKDGFQDADGCPDPDNDGDGIPDTMDKCPNEPEDKDGFQDADGCPDPDNDGDGIADVNDKCPNQAGPPPDGCPLTQQQIAQATRENEKKANSRTAQAMEYLTAGVFDKALEEFQAAYKLVPVPLLLFDIALTYDKMKDTSNALASYKRYVDAEPDGVKAKDARKRIAELSKARPR